jgi:hypothetical protein
MDEGDLMADKCSQLTDSPSAMKYAEDGPFPPVTLFQHIYVGHLQGTESRDFRLWFFFMNQFPGPKAPRPQGPKYTIRVVSNSFQKFAEIFAAQGASPV